MSSSNDFISINDILADVLPMVGDLDFKKGVSRGFYVRQIANAIEELAQDTYCTVLTEDFHFPDTYILPLPENCFNVREIYGFSGDCDKPVNTQEIHFKRHFNNSGGGTDYTARRKEQQPTDPYVNNEYGNNMSFYHPYLYYANIENGDIMFGSTCNAFTWIRIVYNGMGGKIGDVPVIHREFRNAVRDYVRTQVLKVFMVHDRNAMALYQIADMDLNGNGRVPGSWKKAERRIKRMGTWARNNYLEYLSRMNY
jgi:hypothetical protein